MPAFMGVLGFGERNLDRNRITLLGGGLSYETVTLPSGSPSTTALTGSGSWRRPWFDDETAGAFSPSGAEFWFHLRFKPGVNNTGNDTRVLGVGRNGTEYISISSEDTTNKVTIRIAGTLRATATSAAFSLSIYERIHVHVGGASTGDVVDVYANGDLSAPIVTYTLVGADQTALAAIGGLPNEWRFTHNSTTNDNVDDLWCLDPNDPDAIGIQFLIGSGVKEVLVDGDGPEADWLGTFADIDERPCVDADKITAGSVGDESSFTKPAIGEDNVFCFRFGARVTRSGTVAGSNLTLGILAGADTDGATVPAPGDGDVETTYQVGADGLPWSATSYDATRVAFRAET